MPEFTDDETASACIARAVGRRLVPLFWLVWLIAYLDRFNIGFAGLQMRRSLALSDASFGLAAGIFFLGYCVFEIPSNLMLARFGARRWLGRIVISWGVVTVAMTMIRGATEFHVMRLALGLAEAGCYPGLVYYLSHWLPQRQRTDALARISSASQVAGIVGGPLAAVLLAMNGVGGLNGWQWLMLLEGLPAIALGIWILKYLPDSPAGVTWLSSSERKYLADTLARPAREQLPQIQAVIKAFANPQCRLCSIVFFCFNCGLSALVVWLPAMLKRYDAISDSRASILAAIPSVAGLIVILGAGRHSQRVNERRRHVAAPLVIGAFGIAAFGFVNSLPMALLAASIAVVSVGSQPALFSIVSSISSGLSRASAIAMVNSVGILGSFLGPYLLGLARDHGMDDRAIFGLFALSLLGGGVLALLTRLEDPIAIMHPEPINAI